MPSLLVLADDLTGAVDSAAAFQNSHPDAVCAVSAWSIRAEYEWSFIVDSLKPDLFCINTNSRNATAEEARIRVRRAVAWAAKSDFRMMKKVDSLLRGNVLVEIDEFLNGDASRNRPAIFAPALPNQGRTTKDGIQLEHGRPISGSEAHLDPLSPARECDLRNLIPPNRFAVQIPLSTVRSEDLQIITKNFLTSNPVFIPDIESTQDLEKVCSEAMKVKEMSLIGSSGLFSTPSQRTGLNDLDQSADLLIISASLRSEVQSQFNNFISNHPNTEKFELEVKLSVNIEKLKEDVMSSLARCKNVILTVSEKNEISKDLFKREETATSIVRILGIVASSIVKLSTKPLILVLLGGDLGQEFCVASLIKVLIVTGTACQGGAICSQPGGEESKNLTLILRSGGFGKTNSLLELRSQKSETKVPDGGQS